MIEILMVTIMIGVIVAISIPKIGEIKERSSLRASRQVLGAAFSAARSAAIQKGQVATLALSANSATVRVLSGVNKQSVVVLGPLRFDKSLSTTIVPLENAPVSITYDVRGMASPRLDAITRYELRSRTLKDTLCISTTGFLLPADCKL